MPLQRTPPQRVGKPPVSSRRQGDVAPTAYTSLPSPTRAFRPINPGVRHTPPGGLSTRLPPASPPVESEPAPSMRMDMDDPRPLPLPETTPPAVIRATTPPPPAITPPPPAASEYNTPGHTTPDLSGTSTYTPVPAPKTPRSVRKTPAQISQVLDRPAEPIESLPVSQDVFGEDAYGRRWKATTKALDEAAKAGAQKWTTKDLEQSLPMVSALNPDETSKVWFSASQNMRVKMLNRAGVFIEHYKFGPALQLIDQVVDEGRTYAMTHPSTQCRPDAWRPGLSPAALTAAAILPMYDEAYEKLRTEYLIQHDNCKSRYAVILAKQAALQEIEGSVADGVVELEKTIQLLDGFPDEDMLGWMEDVAGKIPGARDP